MATIDFCRMACTVINAGALAFDKSYRKEHPNENIQAQLRRNISSSEELNNIVRGVFEVLNRIKFDKPIVEWHTKQLRRYTRVSQIEGEQLHLCPSVIFEGSECEIDTCERIHNFVFWLLLNRELYPQQFTRRSVLFTENCMPRAGCSGFPCTFRHPYPQIIPNVSEKGVFRSLRIMRSCDGQWKEVPRRATTANAMHQAALNQAHSYTSRLIRPKHPHYENPNLRQFIFVLFSMDSVFLKGLDQLHNLIHAREKREKQFEGLIRYFSILEDEVQQCFRSKDQKRPTDIEIRICHSVYEKDSCRNQNCRGVHDVLLYLFVNRMVFTPGTRASIILDYFSNLSERAIRERCRSSADVSIEKCIYQLRDVNELLQVLVERLPIVSQTPPKQDFSSSKAVLIRPKIEKRVVKEKSPPPAEEPQLAAPAPSTEANSNTSTPPLVPEPAPVVYQYFFMTSPMPQIPTWYPLLLQDGSYVNYCPELHLFNRIGTEIYWSEYAPEKLYEYHPETGQYTPLQE